jgi:hypothetical protein
MTWRSARDVQSKQQQIRAALDAVLAGVSESEADWRPAPGGLTMRETLAHLVLTEQSIVDDIELMLEAAHPELPSIATLDDPARLRAIIEQTGTLAGLLDAFDAACAATVALVEQLDEDQELRSGHSPELGNLLLGAHAALNTRYHYPGHIEELRAVRRLLGLADVELAEPLGLSTGFPA